MRTRYTSHVFFYYELQRLINGVTVELFGDPFNESCVMEHYLSASEDDRRVGSAGVWTPEVDAHLRGGAGNPPFRRPIPETDFSCP